MSIPPPPPPPGTPPPPPLGTPPPMGVAGAPPAGDQSHQGAPLADFGTRLGAWILDSLLYSLVTVPFIVGGVVLIAASFRDCVTRNEEIICPPGAPSTGNIVLGSVVIAFGVLLSLVLYVRAMARTGQPWGARIVGVKVVRSDSDQSLGVGRALGRTLFAGFLSGSICYLGYLWMLWDGRKQTWHDKVVNTVVVRV